LRAGRIRTESRRSALDRTAEETYGERSVKAQFCSPETTAMNDARIQLICTLGPASLEPAVIRQLDARGVNLFRINLSHTALEDLVATIKLVRRNSGAPISLDTEGAQVRCGSVVPDLVLHDGDQIDLLAEDVEGTAERMTLRPGSAFDALRPGSHLSMDFYGVTLRVTETGSARARAVVDRGGRVGSNKAVTVDPAPRLPALTEKDIAAIAIGRRMGIKHYALSFAASGEGVRSIRHLTPAGAHLISKIESRAGLRNMDAIIEASDAVLIDRGDLSREVPLEEVPYHQKAIVRRANRWRKPLYVATNLLESMVLSNRPTIAEVNDVANTLLDGAHGLVLAAETAIGIDPVGAVDMVRRAIEAFERVHGGRELAALGDVTDAAMASVR
jgi:pyruvate kinase